MKNFLFKPIDNAPLILFRIFFGFLFACETFGAILTGWVKDNFLLPDFTFSHIGMEWLQPLPGYGMYFYFAAMGVLSLLVMIGYRYRFSLGMLTLLWAGAYFMQKTSYNNHYYLLLLVAIMLLFLPADRFVSVDVMRNPSKRSLTMPAWCSWVMILQVAIVYLFATIAKFYPDWLDGTFTRNLFTGINVNKPVNYVFAQKWFHIFIAYTGILFDGLIIPALLWKRTRTIALIASLVFHLFNSITLKIGIFPYFALSYAVFFYEPETIRSIFFRNRKPLLTESDLTFPNFDYKKALLWFFVPYFVLQITLPMRHWFIPGDVLWTEEGHRLSWRMMLRNRDGYVSFKVVDKKTGQSELYQHHKFLTRKQENGMASKPDMIWQMAQRIKNDYKAKGKDVAVYADCMVSINHKPFQRLINPKTDLASVEWNYFGHDDWVILYE
ncbi:HTTM domain-containing protein [Flavobacterium sp.]|uniref:HTTM domain-containing protein n=1 Tax=Flavobacterium sp. TaxID=239 RepID=UPI0028BEEEB2|nr:HTTM domain-containing protein [Flavobacterium sp.]